MFQNVDKPKTPLIQSLYLLLKTFNLKKPLVKMAGIALKGQCDLVSIMVPPKVSKKVFVEEKKILKMLNIANLYLCPIHLSD